MNIMSQPQNSGLILSPYETSLLNIWHACGLGVIVEDNITSNPVLVYLQHAQEPEHGFASSLGYPYYMGLRLSFFYSARASLNFGDRNSCMWMFRALSYPMVIKLIRATLDGQYSGPAYQANVYNAAHPTFKHNEVKWEQNSMMFAIEKFPTDLGWRWESAVHWLSSYEALLHYYPDHPLLKKMRKSLLRLGNHGHNELLAAGSKPKHEIRPKTAGARRYMSVKGLDRLSMMRHYAHYCEGEATPSTDFEA